MSITNNESEEEGFVHSGHTLILVSLECPYCKDKIFGEDDMRQLHVYLAHGEGKLWECFQKDYSIYKYSPDSLDQRWDNLLRRVKKLEQEYLLLV
jgi:hypothetical protein